MRIAIDARALAFPPGHRAGIARWAHNLVSGLRDIDADNEYLLLCRSGDRSALQGWGPNFRAIEIDSFGDYTTAHQTTEQLFAPSAIAALSPDVYLSLYFVVPLERPCPAAVVFDDLIPWIIMNRWHHLIPPGQFVGDDMQAFQAWKRLSAQSAEGIVSISDHTARDLSKFWSIERQKIRTVYVGLEPEWYQEPSAADLAEFRARLELPERFILYTGTIEPRKNIEGLIAAYGLLRRRYGHDLPLVVAGSRGQHFDRIFSGSVRREVGPVRFSPARGHHFENVVLMTRFLSRREQVMLYRSATAFVWPSFYEGFGLPVLEAMATGLPTITSPGSSLDEVGGDAVLYADPRNPESIAAQMHRVLSDADLARHLGRSARERSLQFSARKGAAVCLDLLTQLATSPRADRPAEVRPVSGEFRAEELAGIAARLGAQSTRDRIFVFGSGSVGLQLARALSAAGLGVGGFIDSDPSRWGRQIDEWTVHSIVDALLKNPAAIVLGSRASASDMKARLIELGWDSARIASVA
jgi:glycosyltransferase involved in cell wall biosynthesis